jgi:molybdenum cofactor synthesis domain-containing protein
MYQPETMIESNSAMKKIAIEDALGTMLAHDMTQIIPGKYKGAAFKKGDVIKKDNLCQLMRMGKRHLYVLDLDNNHIHEDDAVIELATALAGPGVTFSGTPREGKLQLMADYNGLFKVNVDALVDFNMIQDVMCASRHNNTAVEKNNQLAATRAIPLVIKRDELDKAVAIAKKHYPIFSVKIFNPLKVRLIITGNEVYDGLIEDRFEAIVKRKVENFGAVLKETIILPDDFKQIASTIDSFLNKETDLILTTGGMSVDPDDVTKAGIQKAGFDKIYYSSAVLPGAMFLLGYKGDIAVMGLPACGLYHDITIFDLMLPRILAGEKPDRRELAKLGHGGLCLNCKTCTFPACSFGKTC